MDSACFEDYGNIPLSAETGPYFSFIGVINKIGFSIVAVFRPWYKTGEKIYFDLYFSFNRTLGIWQFVKWPCGVVLIFFYRVRSKYELKLCVLQSSKRVAVEAVSIKTKFEWCTMSVKFLCLLRSLLVATAAMFFSAGYFSCDWCCISGYVNVLLAFGLMGMFYYCSRSVASSIS